MAVSIDETVCTECGAYCGNPDGGWPCEHVQPPPAPPSLKKELARLRKMAEAYEANRLVWACKWCGTPQDDIEGKPAVTCCPACQDGRQQVIQMTFKAAKEQQDKGRS